MTRLKAAKKKSLPEAKIDIEPNVTKPATKVASIHRLGDSGHPERGEYAEESNYVTRLVEDDFAHIADRDLR